MKIVSTYFPNECVSRFITFLLNTFPSDFREAQILRNEADPHSNFRHSGTGNIHTLNTTDIRDKLLEFHEKFYSSNLMSVAVVANRSLEELEKIVVNRFVNIKNKNIKKHEYAWPFPQYGVDTLRKPQKTTESNAKTSNITSQDNICPVQLCITPAKEIQYIDFLFFAPFQNTRKNQRAYEVLATIIGYEDENSLLAALKKENLALDLMTGMQHDVAGFGSYSIRVNVTDKGLKNIGEVGKYVFEYIQMLKETFIEGKENTPSLEDIWKEKQKLEKINFHFQERGTELDTVIEASANVLLYPEGELLSKHRFDELDRERVTDILKHLTLENLRLSICGKNVVKDKYEKDFNAVSEMQTQEEFLSRNELSLARSGNVNRERFYDIIHTFPESLDEKLHQLWSDVGNGGFKLFRESEFQCDKFDMEEKLELTGEFETKVSDL